MSEGNQINLDDIKIGGESVDPGNVGGQVSETAPEIKEGAQGVSQKEYEYADDDDAISIEDKRAPIVILFGPPSSGKSMAIVRLARYLRSQGYIVQPDVNFQYGRKYKKRCEQFRENLSTRDALPGNARDEFLMVKVINHGRTVCQILEAPGEHFFETDPNKRKNYDPHAFEPYLTDIIRNARNRKIWAFLMESEWAVPSALKEEYVSRIAVCKHQLIRQDDSVIMLYNKIDRKHELYEHGHLHVGPAEKNMKDEYDGVAPIFRNPNPISRMWHAYDYMFVPYSTGTFHDKVGGGKSYRQSEDRYPKMFWEAIMKGIKG